MRKPKKQYPCFVCEKLYAEIEEAEECERRHDEQNPREKTDDDPTQGDQRDFKAED